MQFIRFNQLEIQATREYWTADRVANAIPAPLPQVKISKENKQRDHTFSKEETELSFCAAENSRFFPLYAARADVTINPYRQIGRLYYQQNGEDRWATAQVVGSENIILTAAHCLKDEGVWSNYIMFSRVYKDGEAAQNIEIWVLRISLRVYKDGEAAQNIEAIVGSAGIHTQWDVDSWLDICTFDYGFAKIEQKSDAGYLRLSTILPYSLKAVGYPYNYGNVRRFMCEARGTVESIMNGEVKMKRNFMQGGSSGGAWFERDDDGEVVGINVSGDCMGNMYGPFFNSMTLDLFHFVRTQHE